MDQVTYTITPFTTDIVTTYSLMQGSKTPISTDTNNSYVSSLQATLQQQAATIATMQQQIDKLLG